MLDILNSQLATELENSPKSPKYLCLRDAVLALIVANTLPAGTRLPTEQALAKALPLSLGTIQNGLKSLVDSGDLVRQRRHGTFVADINHNREIGTPTFQFIRPDGTPVRLVFITLLKREALNRKGPWQDHLGACDAGYVHLVRQDRIDGAFHCHTEVYLRADLAAGLLDADPDQLEHETLIPLLQKAGTLNTWQAVNRLTQLTLPKTVHRIVWPTDSPADARGLRLETHYQTDLGDTFAWQIMHIPLNDYSISMTTRSA
ncbi:GntR family transcriptional regulator [Saccharospirillum impatiens]|uniref:GntR family transcriptional regulator n=1 Tax=Saccharospirillum impatiens TaxID=169438 RepID=UPI00041D6B89|nr:GntR family transcriptional regulator [Saccharospirillum impatiens]